jgi:hypothetical protein
MRSYRIKGIRIIKKFSNCRIIFLSNVGFILIIRNCPPPPHSPPCPNPQRVAKSQIRRHCSVAAFTDQTSESEVYSSAVDQSWCGIKIPTKWTTSRCNKKLLDIFWRIRVFFLIRDTFLAIAEKEEKSFYLFFLFRAIIFLSRNHFRFSLLTLVSSGVRSATNLPMAKLH